MRGITLAAMMAGGCGGGDVAAACGRYVDAYEACARADPEAASDAFALADTYCDDVYGAVRDARAARYLECLADAYEAAECADPAGLDGLDAAAAACEL